MTDAMPDLPKKFDTCSDFDRIIDDRMPALPEEGWTRIPPGCAIVGRLTSEQEAVPCVYVDVWSIDLETKAIHMRYESAARYGVSCTIDFVHRDGLCYRAEYEEDMLESCTRIASIEAPDTDELTVDDRCSLFGVSAE